MMMRGHAILARAGPSFAHPPMPHPAVQQSPASQGGLRGAPPHSLLALRPLLLLGAENAFATHKCLGVLRIFCFLFFSISAFKLDMAKQLLFCDTTICMKLDMCFFVRVINT